MAPADDASTTPDGAPTADGTIPPAADRPGGDDRPATFYAAVGGAAALAEAVERFYARILADPMLAGRFEGVDMPRLKRHQALLLAQVLGGPQEYGGRPLGEAHAGMGISGAEYARVGEHLTGVLEELGVGADVLAAVSATLTAVEPEIVGSGAAAGQA